MLMGYSIYLIVGYVLVIIAVCYRIIINSTTPSKTLAYLLLVTILPIIGVVFYLSVGLNYRKRKLYQKKIDIDDKTYPELLENIHSYSRKVLDAQKERLGYFYPLACLFINRHLLSDCNDVMLLENGEHKFPEVLQNLRAAKHHIHIEYYIYEDDEIGGQIADILMAKAKEGVQVRFIYDDFGSRSVRKKLVPMLKKAGVEAYPFFEVKLIYFANRMNYRNHRKIIVVDGEVGYVGGINVSDKYINTAKNKLYWRDTHLKVVGESVMNLQFTFLTDWNFCSGQNISYSTQYFLYNLVENKAHRQLVQIHASGPDSDYPGIMYSLIQILLLARNRVYITTPYFIPEKSFLDALKIARLSNVEVILLVPGISDSWIVNTTSQSYYAELLAIGIRIFRYQKGFVHAKTMVCDDFVSVVGTSNLDNRSFDLNFEVNAVVFDDHIAAKMVADFMNDLQNSTEIILEDWLQRPATTQFMEKLLQLFSPLM